MKDIFWRIGVVVVVFGAFLFFSHSGVTYEEMLTWKGYLALFFFIILFIGLFVLYVFESYLPKRKEVTKKKSAKNPQQPWWLGVQIYSWKFRFLIVLVFILAGIVHLPAFIPALLIIVWLITLLFFKKY